MNLSTHLLRVTNNSVIDWLAIKWHVNTRLLLLPFDEIPVRICIIMYCYTNILFGDPSVIKFVKKTIGRVRKNFWKTLYLSYVYWHLIHWNRFNILDAAKAHIYIHRLMKLLLFLLSSPQSVFFMYGPVHAKFSVALPPFKKIGI